MNEKNRNIGQEILSGLQEIKRGEHSQRKTEGADILSHLNGKIQAFRDIDDPVAYQRKLRAEWDRGWEK